MPGPAHPIDEDAADLATDTAVTAVRGRPGAYRAELPTSWSYIWPSGGVLTTVALRAMVAELDDPTLRPISATTIFCSTTEAGPLAVDVTTLRRGKSACQLRASLRAEAGHGAGLEVTATFGRRREGPDARGRTMPDVPGPADSIPAGPRSIGREAPRRASRPFFRQLEMALAVGQPFWTDRWEADEARSAFWYRYRRRQRLESGELDPLAIPPIADTMPSALTIHLGPEAPRFYAPSLDLTVHFLDPSESEWFLVDVWCPRARDGYATAHGDVWSDKGELVATTTQTMILTPRRR